MKLLVTDLDNTLYDWVTYFATSFSAMTDVLQSILQVSREQLFAEFKVVHERHGESERAYSALELPSVRKQFPELSRAELLIALRPAFDAFSEQRKSSLVLYDGVEATLNRLETRGVVIVGHTEASEHNAIGRLDALGIGKYFQRVYALESPAQQHPDPEFQVRPSLLRERLVRVPRAERKPNPALLLRICDDESVRVLDSVYIGDSVTRDISMANACGVQSVWAKYGTRYDIKHWNTLVQITHWTPQDVERERALKAQFATSTPKFVAESFADVTQLFH